MDRRYKSLRENQLGHRRENPSFSSSLLDAIYRSIDEGPDQEQEDRLIFYRETMKKQKQSKCFEQGEAQVPRYSKGLTAEKVSEKVMVHRNFMTEFDRRTRSKSSSLSFKSSSSSSDSSSGGGFSSESESFNSMQRPKPIKTSVSSTRSGKAEVVDAFRGHRNFSSQTQKPKQEAGFVKTKSKALRILYGDLKKAKPPNSPGAKLASFLNSLFTAGGNTKKVKVSTSAGGYESKSAQGSTCSSASSFSRSCLSKTPSSRSGTKRSVRFCPVSVIVDEDCRPCGHKNLYEDEPRLMASIKANNATMRRINENDSNEELNFHVMQESRRVEEVARELLRNYHKKNLNEVGFDIHNEEDDDDEDDDVASCASSDLFELDNLSAIGIERYREELPVYETTHFSTNRAIANGFIL